MHFSVIKQLEIVKSEMTIIVYWLVIEMFSCQEVLEIARDTDLKVHNS